VTTESPAEPQESTRLTVLCDNTAAVEGVRPGHGLAVLVEAADRRVLFDAGPDERTVANADALGVSLARLDAIVVSHSHYDHTGGLAAVLGRTGQVAVLAHTLGLQESFVHDPDGTARQIGPPLSSADYGHLGARFEWGTGPRRLGESLLLPGEMAPSQGSGAAGAFSRPGANGLVGDDFHHEQALVVLADEGSLILTGCAHAGAVGIARHVRQVCPECPPTALMGGLHLGAATEGEVRDLALKLHALGVRGLLPCHCTGQASAAALKAHFPGEVIGVGVGSVVTVLRDGTIGVQNPVAL